MTDPSGSKLVARSALNFARAFAWHNRVVTDAIDIDGLRHMAAPGFIARRFDGQEYRATPSI